MDALKKRDRIDIKFNLYPDSKFYRQKRAVAEWRFKALSGVFARQEHYQDWCHTHLNYE